MHMCHRQLNACLGRIVDKVSSVGQFKAGTCKTVVAGLTAAGEGAAVVVTRYIF